MNATFTASLSTDGTYYNCHGEVAPDGGPHDWYIINWNTGIYTYIGTSADYYIDFNVFKPSMYGNYRLWAEGPNGAGFTGYQYLGDPYVGVSVSAGVLQFIDQAAFDALYARINAAYENHQANFFNSNNSFSDNDIDALIISTGFDEHQPMEEFEAY